MARYQGNFKVLLVPCGVLVILALTFPAARGSNISSNAGPPYPWQVGVGNVNTFNGNLLTTVPVVSWFARGGLPVNLSLCHNSETSFDGELGPKWSCSYDILFSTDSGGNVTVNWGNGNVYTFTPSYYYYGGSYSSPPGIHDTLVQNSDGSFTITKKDQTSYHFTVTPSTNGKGYCVGISDENGNAITINRNASNLVSSVVDPTGRTINFIYNSTNRLTSVTDPLGRAWTFGYDSNGDLSAITYPVLNGTYYGDSFTYNSNNDIISFIDPNGNKWQYAYNVNGQYPAVGADAAISITDPLNHTTSYGFTSGNLMYTTVTDPNRHSTEYYYAFNNSTATYCNSLTQDAAGYQTAYQWDGNNNKTSILDADYYMTNFTYDGNGNMLTVATPLNETTTYTYNSHNKVLTVTDAMGNKTVNTYDAHDNLIQVQKKNPTGTDR